MELVGTDSRPSLLKFTSSSRAAERSEAAAGPITGRRLSWIPARAPGVSAARLAGMTATEISNDIGLAEIPEQACHDAEALAGDGRKQMFVGCMLRAARIGMRHPDCLQSQHLGKNIVRKRAAGIGQNDWCARPSSVRSSGRREQPRDRPDRAGSPGKNRSGPGRTSTL